MSTNINSTEQIVEINAGDQITNVNIVSQSTTQVISGEQVVTVDVNAGTIPAAWGSITGTLSNQTDLQNALNAKQNNITLTTTGTTGVATLVGATLNIPNYVSSTKQTEWDSAYNDKINSAEVSGTTTKTLTLTQQDGGIIQASWSDFDTAPVTSVFGRTGDVVATEGDYNINQLGDVTITSATNGQVLKYNGTAWVNAADASGLTSVGLAMPSAFTVSGSPLTSNGTITVTGAGTTSQYVRGDGSLAAFPSVSNEAKTLIREVYNKTGATLTKGTVIYIDGGQGNLPTVTKAIATGDPTSAQTFGIVQSDITNMNNGFVVVAGGIDNLDTQAYPEGTALYLSPTTAGAWTSTKPYAPDHMVYLGVVVRSHPTQGVIEVKIQNGVELDEIHNVSARFPVNKDGLFYNSTSGVWENKSIAGVLGYTPVPETRIITINGTAQNLSADRTWNVGTVTSVAASGGTGISVAGSPVTGSGTITITNTAPDQVVGLTGAGTTSISGTYPNFTITSNDQYTGTVTSVAASGGTGISISGSPVTGSGTISITNTAPDQIVSLTGAGTTSISGTYPNFTVTSNDQYVGTVTSVNATVPTGFEVSGVPITSSGTVDIKFASGYSLPTNAKQTQWDDAYAKRINSLTVTGNSGSSTLVSNVLNVPTYTLAGLGGEPAITAGTTSQYWRGDKSFQTLDTSVVPENGNVYFTEQRVRATVLSGLNITGGSISASDSVLNAFGKVQNQINGLIGGSIFQSTWNASTNTPSLASGVGTKGYYYIVSVAGTTNLDGITDWQIGDWAIFDGTVWRKVDNTDAVVSVNGYTGVVNLVLDDLADVSAASPTDTQLLRFNGTTSKWYNWTPTFEPALTKGNLTEATSSVLTITGGSNAVIGSGTTIEVKSASETQNGIVTTGTQTFAGNKTFNGVIGINNTLSFSLGNGINFQNSSGNSNVSVYNSGGTGASILYITSPATFNSSVNADQFLSINNGNGTNYKIGDDAWIGDINVANTFRISGVQDSTKGYITFGSSSNTALGRSGTGNLTWGSDTIYHTGNLINPVTGTGTQYQIPYFSTTGSTITGSANIITNVNGDFIFGNPNSATATYLRINHKDGVDGGLLLYRDISTTDWQIINANTSGNLSFYSYGTASNSLVIAKSTGIATFSSTVIASSIGVNSSTLDNSKLVVNTGTGANFRVAYTANNRTEIGNYTVADGYQQTDIVSSLITFATGTAGGGSATERGRFTTGGWFKASNTGAYAAAEARHEIRSNQSDNNVYLGNSHATTPYGPWIHFSGVSPNNRTSYFLIGSDTTSDRFFIYSDGGARFGNRVQINSTDADGMLNIKTASAISYSPTTYMGTSANIRLMSGGTVATGTTTGISFGVGGSAEIYVGAVQQANNYADLVFQSYSPGGVYSEKMRLTNGGELLINTTTDAGDYKLQVNGNVYLAGGGDLVISPATSGVDAILYNDIGVLVSSASISVNGTGLFSDVLTVARPAMTTQSDYGYQNIKVTSGFGSGYTGAKIQSLLAGYDSSIYGVDIGYSYDGGGAGNTGYSLRFSTNDDLTGNPIERLRINSTGAATFSSTVGVGGTSAINTFTVRTATNNNLDVFDNTTGVAIQAVNNANTVYKTLSFLGSSLSFTGAATFSSRITANGGVSTTGANGFTDTDGTITAGFYANFTGGNAGIGTTTNHTFAFYTTATERMRLNNGGQFLVNTTTNTTIGGFTNTTVGIKQLANGVAGGGLHIEQSNDQSVAFFGFTGTGAFRIGTSYRTTGSYQPIAFNTNGADRLTIYNSGQVRIGSGDADGTLHIRNLTANTYSATAYNGGNSSIRITTPSSGTNITTGIAFAVSGSTEAYIGAVQNASSYADIVFQTYNGTYGERLRIASNGAATFSSSVTATSFFESSDIRLKSNIEDYNSNDILNISAKIYEKDGKIEIGYLAQDLESVLKSAVSVRDNGYLDLSYRQVHTAKIAALENEIKQLKNKLNELGR